MSTSPTNGNQTDDRSSYLATETDDALVIRQNVVIVVSGLVEGRQMQILER
jgi:hypothetical protein